MQIRKRTGARWLSWCVLAWSCQANHHNKLAADQIRYVRTSHPTNSTSWQVTDSLQGSPRRGNFGKLVLIINFSVQEAQRASTTQDMEALTAQNAKLSDDLQARAMQIDAVQARA